MPRAPFDQEIEDLKQDASDKFFDAMLHNDNSQRYIVASELSIEAEKLSKGDRAKRDQVKDAVIVMASYACLLAPTAEHQWKRLAAAIAKVSSQEVRRGYVLGLEAVLGDLSQERKEEEMQKPFMSQYVAHHDRIYTDIARMRPDAKRSVATVTQRKNPLKNYKSIMTTGGQSLPEISMAWAKRAESADNYAQRVRKAETLDKELDYQESLSTNNMTGYDVSVVRVCQAYLDKDNNKYTNKALETLKEQRFTKEETTSLLTLLDNSLDISGKKSVFYKSSTALREGIIDAHNKKLTNG